MFVAIERGADEPKVYDLEIAAPKPVDTGGGDHGDHGKGGNGKGGNGKTGTGSVNVWDRYGGSGGGGRDDPNQ